MRSPLGAAVELLEPALDYTCAQLSGVEAALLDRPTPCAGWTLAELLAHMADSLDAFTEAAVGEVGLEPGRATRCVPGDVVVGGLDLHSDLLVGTAALEIAVHGWDVGRSTGLGAPLPEPLGRALLPVATAVVDASDRGVRFAPALAPGPDATYAERLLAFLGRS